MLLVDGKNITPFLDGPTVRACDIELVRAEFYRQYPAEGDPRKKAETRRQAFHRVLKSAQDSTLIMLREIDGTQYVWLVKNETGA
jgi:Fe-S-cluster containining protein